MGGKIVSRSITYYVDYSWHISADRMNKFSFLFLNLSYITLNMQINMGWRRDYNGRFVLQVFYWKFACDSWIKYRNYYIVLRFDLLVSTFIASIYLDDCNVDCLMTGCDVLIDGRIDHFRRRSSGRCFTCHQIKMWLRCLGHRLPSSVYNMRFFIFEKKKDTDI